MPPRLLVAIAACSTLWCHAQDSLLFAPQVPVHRNGVPLAMPWAGGLNAPQFSAIDLDQDGLQDLFVLDRMGNVALFLMNTGSIGQPQYRPTRAYDQVQPFPQLHDWALMRDYDCDGKADIFAYTSGAFAVYRNTSDASGPAFTLADGQVGSNYVPTVSPNLYISNVDLPGMADLDGDGDLDILTFSIWGNYLEYHKNLSMELYAHCDSLAYEVRSRCWGEFRESMDNQAVTLNVPCTDNVPNPELPPMHGGTPPDAGDRAHSGSTILPLDLDGDGDMDLLLGDIESPALVALTNGGSTAHAVMTGADTLFPSYGVPIDLQQFLAGFFVDIDLDGRRDLVVAPNSTTAAENAKGTWYYRNTGTDAAPHFTYMRDDLFQGDMLDFGQGAHPVLFDHNGDGFMDLVVANDHYFSADGNHRGRLALLENTGVAGAPAFTVASEDYAALSSLSLGTGLHPAFGDVDGDGRADLVLGGQDGTLHLLRNTSTGALAQFQTAPEPVVDDQGAVIDVGANATPLLFDLDSDGLPDLIIGERNGNLNHYRNTGTPQAAVWHLETADLGQVSVNEYWSNTGYSVPFLMHDPEGNLLFFSGSESGGIHRYEVVSGGPGTAWTRTDSTWADLHEGWRTAIAFHDFTGDGKPDAVVGNARGGLSFWASEQTDYTGTAALESPIPFSIFPNPTDGRLNIQWHAAPVAELKAILTDGLGRAIRTGSITGPAWSMDLSDLPAGLYLLTLSDGRASWSQRVLVAPH